MNAPLLARLSVYIPPDVHRSLKVEAASRGMTMGEVIVEALQTRVRFISPRKEDQ